MRRHEDDDAGPRRRAAAAATESLGELRFDTGAFAIYHPDNHDAWLWTDTPVEF
jgi:hypothetical protein